MSFDVFCQGFSKGDASDTGLAEMMAVLEPLVVTGAYGLDLRTVDGSAELYVGAQHLMISRPAGVEVWEVLVRGARAANWVILPIGCPTLLTRPEQGAELPPELADDVVLVESGADALR